MQEEKHLFDSFRDPLDVQVAEGHNYCICQLVMNSDKYVLSAIAFINSIKEHLDPNGPPIDFAVFVSDISQIGKDSLGKVATHVIEVPKICANVDGNIWPRFKHAYGWLNSCFTKLYCLKLTGYQKVLFLDSDMLCFGNIQPLFQQLATPAGCLVSSRKNGFQSGKRIPFQDLLEALSNGYGISGACFMVQPSMEAFKRALDRVDSRIQQRGHYVEDFESFLQTFGERALMEGASFRAIAQMRATYGERRRFNAGPDEQLITWLFADKWTNISRQYCCVPWLKHRFERGGYPIDYLDGPDSKRSYDVSDIIDCQDPKKGRQQPRKVFIIHYVSEKPWDKIATGGKLWPDCKLFFDQLERWTEGREYVTQTFGDVSSFQYMPQEEADNIYDNDPLRKYDKGTIRK